MKNQTDPRWLDGPENETGTGIFIVPDVENSEALAVKRVLVPGLKYLECVTRAILALAFKWVPDRVVSYKELDHASCGQRCVESCPTPGCICINGICK